MLFLFLITKAINDNIVAGNVLLTSNGSVQISVVYFMEKTKPNTAVHLIHIASIKKELTGAAVALCASCFLTLSGTALSCASFNFVDFSFLFLFLLIFFSFLLTMVSKSKMHG